MASSMVEYLQSDMECKGSLECLHGLKRLDRRCFEVLVEIDDRLTVDEVTEAIERERSTVYRSIQHLLQAGFTQKQQVNYEHGGYYYAHHSTDPNEVADNMQRMLNDWYAQVDTLIQESRNKYDEKIIPAEQVFSVDERPPPLDQSVSQIDQVPHSTTQDPQLLPRPPYAEE